MSENPSSDPLEMLRSGRGLPDAVEVARRAVEIGADMLVVHRPFLLRGVNSVATTTAKGATVTALVDPADQTRLVQLADRWRPDTDELQGDELDVGDRAAVEALPAAAAIRIATWRRLRRFRGCSAPLRCRKRGPGR